MPHHSQSLLFLHVCCLREFIHEPSACVVDPVPVAPRRTPLSELWNDARRLPSPVIVNFSKKVRVSFSDFSLGLGLGLGLGLV